MTRAARAAAMRLRRLGRRRRRRYPWRNERPQHCGCAFAGIGRAAGVEARTLGGSDDLAPQLGVLGPEAADRDVHMVAIETAQELLDDRIMVMTTRETGDPGFRPRGRQAQQVP